eukprot:gnl/TRDRNA2_/TRDRNA2_72598_c1_seq1.p1 gnl/TRDRNA2_/TRDRNA2_72598_c1~~gnl/TRDRNA2_/TRDRNA2_72598_c1_seq1.p1  ORF type:complete len:493 (-),score=104.71 gnl/TRDRNA2_/TRDRNA2_72598_c1_seq1:88-1566(-)
MATSKEEAGQASETTPLQEKEPVDTWSNYTYQIVIAGTGFLADAYDLFVIDMVISILHRLHPEGMDPSDKSWVAAATLIGAIVGQLFFGIAGDWLGRKITFVVTCFLIIAGAVASGLVQWNWGSFTIIHQLVICRFILGVGVGGEYPLAASIAAEGATTAQRGRLISAVFSMQGWGMLLSTLFVLLFLACGMPLEYIWRTVLILGAVPSALIVYMRSQMEDSELYKKSHEKEVANGVVTIGAHLATAAKYVRHYWHPMIGTTMTWFILDVTFYGTGSFKSRIGSFLIAHDADATDREKVRDEAIFAMICCFMAIPGYLLAVAFMDKIGRWNLQFWGFIAMSVNFFLIASLSGVLQDDMRWMLVMFFGLTFLFSNFGPNTTTFVIPVEVYPTVIRATCHGISAAAGKAGAAVGAIAFSPAEAAFGLEIVLGACGVVCVTGAVLTFFFTSDKVVDLSVLDEEVAKDFEESNKNSSEANLEQGLKKRKEGEGTAD